MLDNSFVNQGNNFPTNLNPNLNPVPNSIPNSAREYNPDAANAAKFNPL
jgi:hypothetical protein